MSHWKHPIPPQLCVPWVGLSIAQVIMCTDLAVKSFNTKHLTINVRNGHIKRITDDGCKSLVLEITGTNVATTFISAPADPRGSLGVKLVFLCMVIKNLKKYFSFEITVLDDKNFRRRFRASNYQSTTRVRPFCCSMPIGLNPGWNQIQFNLADFTRRAYDTTYVECVRVQIHANCRIRRIYFSERLYSEDELPLEYKMVGPEERRASLAAMQMQQQQQPLQQPQIFA